MTPILDNNPSELTHPCWTGGRQIGIQDAEQDDESSQVTPEQTVSLRDEQNQPKGEISRR